MISEHAQIYLKNMTRIKTHTLTNPFLEVWVWVENGNDKSTINPNTLNLNTELCELHHSVYSDDTCSYFFNSYYMFFDDLVMRYLLGETL